MENGKLQAQPVLCSWQVGTLPNLAMPSNHSSLISPKGTGIKKDTPEWVR